MSTTAKDPLRERAAAIVATCRKALDVRREAERLNQAEQDRLQRLADEIARTESTLDPEDLPAVQVLQARKTQLGLLCQKAERECAARMKSANERANAEISGANVHEFWKSAHDYHKARLLKCLSPEFHLPVQGRSLEIITNNLPSLERLRFWRDQGHTIPLESVAARLAPFISGEVEQLWRI